MPALEDWVEDAVGELFRSFVDAGQAGMLARVADEALYLGDHLVRPGDPRRQQVEPDVAGGVQAAQPLIQVDVRRPGELIEDLGKRLEGIGTSCHATVEPRFVAWGRRRLRVLAELGDQDVSHREQDSALRRRQRMRRHGEAPRHGEASRLRRGGRWLGQGATSWFLALSAIALPTRRASAEIVHVGLAEPPVTKMLPSAM